MQNYRNKLILQQKVKEGEIIRCKEQIEVLKGEINRSKELINGCKMHEKKII